MIINDSMQNRDFRNLLAHYGLGQYLTEEDIISSDVLKGLTMKAFYMEYLAAKQQLFEFLNSLRDHIQKAIFN